jgi:hypothetical protein
MNDTAEKLAAHVIEMQPEPRRTMATTMSLPFNVAAQHADLAVPLRRPNRCIPIAEKRPK